MPRTKLNESDWPSLWPQRAGPQHDGPFALIAEVLRTPDGDGIVEQYQHRNCRYTDPRTFDATTRADAVTALRTCCDCACLNSCYQLAENRAAQARQRRDGTGFDGICGGELYGQARKWLK
jgi:hypothetical protein